MKTTYSRKQIGLAVAGALALSFASAAVQAQSRGVPIDNRQVWVDQSQAQVWMNGFGECWHSAYGPPPSVGPCAPAPIAQYVAPPPPPAPAPVYVAPPPPPAPAPVIVPAPLPPRQTRG